MYESYWQLHCNPFENDADARFFFVSETHQASLLKLRYLVENGKGAGLLLGGTGAGKSYLAQILLQQLRDVDGPCVHLVFPQLSPSEFLAYLAVELGAEQDHVGFGPGRLDQVVREIERLLVKFKEQGRRPVIVIDEAHLVDDPQVFQTLRLLLNFQQSRQAPLTLILCGQRELLPRVRRIGQLDERIAVKCLLRPLDEDETIAYIGWRLQVAGAQGEIFDVAARRVVYELSGGVPRRINRICDLSLLVGFADETPSISSEQVAAVADELTTAIPD